ncbi:MAG: hypothetical protein J7K00_04600 [Candidatus Diapherotrites archaeon]|nr:hypothetical protein [Candidatus Diapherotrites archaeon]
MKPVTFKISAILLIAFLAGCVTAPQDIASDKSALESTIGDATATDPGDNLPENPATGFETTAVDPTADQTNLQPPETGLSPQEECTALNLDNPAMVEICIVEKALELNDASICDALEYEEIKTSCIVKVTKDTSLCDAQDTQWKKDNCFMDYAIFSQDIKICENVLDPLNKNTCIAQTSTDPEICNGLGTEMEQENCLFSMALRTKNIEICPESKSDSSTICRAALNNDVSACQAIKDEISLNQCILTVAIENNDAQSCESITMLEMKNDCLAMLGSGTPEDPPANGPEAEDETTGDSSGFDIPLTPPPEFILQ